MSRTHTAPDVPAATRAQPPGWRDPRLWVGVALVAVSVVAGARLLDGADETVTVWAAASDLAPGDRLTADDLVATSVRFEEPADLDRYLATDDPLPDGLQLVRGLGEGELVPGAALGSPEESDTVSLSLSFPSELVPSGIETGSVVELWVVPGGGVATRRAVRPGAERRRGDRRTHDRRLARLGRRRSPAGAGHPARRVGGPGGPPRRQRGAARARPRAGVSR